jgi:hypothetical protein
VKEEGKKRQRRDAEYSEKKKKTGKNLIGNGIRTG